MGSLTAAAARVAYSLQKEIQSMWCGLRASWEKGREASECYLTTTIRYNIAATTTTGSTIIISTSKSSSHLYPIYHTIMHSVSHSDRTDARTHARLFSADIRPVLFPSLHAPRRGDGGRDTLDRNPCTASVTLLPPSIHICQHPLPALLL